MSDKILVLHAGQDYSTTTPYEWSAGALRATQDDARSITVAQLREMLSRFPDDAQLWFDHGQTDYLTDLLGLRIEEVALAE